MQEVTKIPACLAAARTAPARSKVCRSCTMGFCAMFPAEKSAMSSAVVLLSSVISAIHHLPRSLTTPLGYVRSPYVGRDGHNHACRISPSSKSSEIPLALAMGRKGGANGVGRAFGVSCFVRTHETPGFSRGEKSSSQSELKDHKMNLIRALLQQSFRKAIGPFTEFVGRDIHFHMQLLAVAET